MTGRSGSECDATSIRRRMPAKAEEMAMETRRSMGRKLEVTEPGTNGRDPGRGPVTHCGFCGVDLDGASSVAPRFGEAFCSEAHADAFVGEVRAARAKVVALAGSVATDGGGTGRGGQEKAATGRWDLKRALTLVACCGLPILAVVVLAGGGGALLGAGATVLPVLALLACPLGMLFMMWGMRNHGKDGSGDRRSQESDDKPR